MAEGINNIDLSGYSAADRATLEAAVAIMGDTLHWDRDTICRTMVHDWTTVTRFLQGKPQGDVATIIADFARLVHRYGQQTLGKTPVILDFERVLTNSRRDGKMGIIVDRNGRGKSACIRDYARRNPRANAEVVQCPSICQRKDLVQLLCEAVGLSTSSMKQPEWERKLFETVTAKNMLIIDEAGYLVDEHKRKTSPLRMLQDISDRCGAAIVMVMRPEQWNRLIYGKTANEDEQLIGRFVHRAIHLKLDYKREEIETIIRLFHKGEISKKLRQAVKILLGREVGGIRALTHDLASAADFVKAHGGEFDEAFIAASELRETAPHLDKLENF